MRLHRPSSLIAVLAVSFVATAFPQPRMNAVIGGAGQEYANAVTTRIRPSLIPAAALR